MQNFLLPNYINFLLALLSSYQLNYFCYWLKYVIWKYQFKALKAGPSLGSFSIQMIHNRVTKYIL